MNSLDRATSPKWIVSVITFSDPFKSSQEPGVSFISSQQYITLPMTAPSVEPAVNSAVEKSLSSVVLWIRVASLPATEANIIRYVTANVNHFPLFLPQFT